MIRGTTPTNEFNVDTDLTMAVGLYITYGQKPDNEDKYEPVIERTLENITVTPDMLTVRLTQEETLSLDADKGVGIQCRALFADGSAIASKTVETTVEEIIKEGVI